MLVFLILFFPLVPALTGEVITGEVSQDPTNVSIFVLPGPPVIYIYSPEQKTYYTKNLILNYSIKNNFYSVWYNLDNNENISLPNLSNYETNFNTTLGEHTLNLYANNTNFTNLKQVTFTVSNKPATTSNDNSPGGGSDPGGSTPLSNFEVDRELIEVSLLPSQSKDEIIKVTNTGDTSLILVLEIVGINEFLHLEEEFLALEKGKTKDVLLHFFPLSNTTPGIYPGKLVMGRGGLNKEVNIVIEIKSKDPLFDIKLEINNKSKTVNPKEDIEVAINLFNLGLYGTEVDVELVLYITDFEKNIVHQSSKEFLAVQRETTIYRELGAPPELVEGTYLLVGNLSFNNITVSSYDSFEIVKEKSIAYLYIILAICLLLIIIFIIKRFGKKIIKK